MPICLRASERSTSRPHCLDLSKNYGFDGCFIVKNRVLAVRAETRRNDGAVLCKVEKDVSRHLWGALKPIWIVKCPAIDAKYPRKSLKIEK